MLHELDEFAYTWSFLYIQRQGLDIGTPKCVYERKFIADKLWAYLVAFNSCQRRGMVANNPPWGAIIIVKCAVLGCEMQLFN